MPVILWQSCDVIEMTSGRDDNFQRRQREQDRPYDVPHVFVPFSRWIMKYWPPGRLGDELHRNTTSDILWIGIFMQRFKIVPTMYM